MNWTKDQLDNLIAKIKKSNETNSSVCPNKDELKMYIEVIDKEREEKEALDEVCNQVPTEP